MSWPADEGTSPWDNDVINRMGGAILRQLSDPNGPRDIEGVAAALGLPLDLTAGIVSLLIEDGLVGTP